MIRLGLGDTEKDVIVGRYVASHAVRHVVVLTQDRFRMTCSAPSHEHVEWDDIIRYRFYYRLLQEIDADTLVVINECLRTQDRYDLTYNCIRNFLNQTHHQIVFQRLPIIDTVDDLGVLLDFDTRSRFKREKVRAELFSELDVRATVRAPLFEAIHVAVDDGMRVEYARAKRALIDGIGLKDPHTIPRHLHLLAGKAKLAHVDPGQRYVGRNNRFGLDNLETYKDADGPGDRDVFEFCHNAIDMADLLAVAEQTRVRALVSDLKVDRWYFNRYAAWCERIREAYAMLGAT